jgi:Ca2+-binding EF-hand superfamily protein
MTTSNDDPKRGHAILDDESIKDKLKLQKQQIQALDAVNPYKIYFDKLSEEFARNPELRQQYFQQKIGTQGKVIESLADKNPALTMALNGGMIPLNAIDPKLTDALEHATGDDGKPLVNMDQQIHMSKIPELLELYHKAVGKGEGRDDAGKKLMENLNNATWTKGDGSMPPINYEEAFASLATFKTASFQSPAGELSRISSRIIDAKPELQDPELYKEYADARRVLLQSNYLVLKDIKQQGSLDPLAVQAFAKELLDPTLHPAITINDMLAKIGMQNVIAAPVVTDAERAQLEAKGIDHNNVQKEVLQKESRGLTLLLDSNEIDPYARAAMMAQMDANHDNSISNKEINAFGNKLNDAVTFFAEEEAAAKAGAISTHENLTKTMKVFDLDGNGKVDSQERAIVKKEQEIFKGLLASNGFEAKEQYSFKEMNNKMNELGIAQGGKAPAQEQKVQI